MTGQCLRHVKQEIQISCASSGFEVDICYDFYPCNVCVVLMMYWC